MRNQMRHHPVVYTLMGVLVIMLATVNCTIGSLVAEAPTSTPRQQQQQSQQQ